MKWYWVILYWLAFIAMWVCLFAPQVYDIVIFVLYAVYDFGSAWEVYLNDHLTGWSYWAIASFVYSALQAIYQMVILVYILIEMFFSGEDAFNIHTSILSDQIWFWAFMAANAVGLAIPMSKLIVIFQEIEEEDDVDGLFKLKSK